MSKVGQFRTKIENPENLVKFSILGHFGRPVCGLDS